MSDGRYDRADGQISMEDTYVKHYMYALDRLQSCWVNDSGFNKDKFNLQLLYLIRLLPDKIVQKKILKGWNESINQSKDDMPNLTEAEIQSFAGMEVVTELILFVCDAFELINTDIVGPATTKQYQREVIQLQEMPEDIIKIPGGSASE